VDVDAYLDLVSASPWTYLAVLGLVLGDAIVPLFPGESAVVAASVLAADGELRIWLVWLAAAAGAFIGDTIMFTVGRLAGPRVNAWIRGRGWGERLDRAQVALDRRGASLIPAAQFIPGGRNLVMISAGGLGYPLRRFLPAEGVGVALWATFQTAIGYVGGRTFEGTWTALLVSLAIAVAVGGAIELVDRRRRNRPDAPRTEGDGVPPPG
jgi:membrane protein DedA with SNARE-associated domain